MVTAVALFDGAEQSCCCIGRRPVLVLQQHVFGGNEDFFSECSTAAFSVWWGRCFIPVATRSSISLSAVIVSELVPFIDLPFCSHWLVNKERRAQTLGIAWLLLSVVTSPCGRCGRWAEPNVLSSVNTPCFGGKPTEDVEKCQEIILRRQESRIRRVYVKMHLCIHSFRLQN